MKVTQRFLSAVLTLAAIAFAIAAAPADAHHYRVRTNRVSVGAIDYGYGRYDSPCNYGNRRLMNNSPFIRRRRFIRNRHFNRFNRYETDRSGIYIRF